MEKIDPKIISLLNDSCMLSLRDYVTLSWILRRPVNWVEFVRKFLPPTDGKARLKFWMTSIKSSIHTEIFSMRKAATDCTFESMAVDLYQTSLSSIDFSEINKFSSGLPGEIMRDVMRTFQTYPIFKEGQMGYDMLTRILFAISVACPEVGYCQGMNFVAANLICARINYIPELYQSIEDLHSNFTHSNMAQSEAEIFAFMMELIQRNGKIGMQGLWGQRVPRLKLRVYQLDRFLRWNYPHLHEHFVKINLSPEVLTAQWFVTLFSYSFPNGMTLQLWDYIFLAGWEGIFRIAVSILGLMQNELLALDDMESVAMLMREWKKPNYLSSYFSMNQLLEKADQLIITEEVLLKLQESFASEVLSMAVILKYSHDHPDPNHDPSEEFDITQKSVIKKALPAGVEPPTFWLMRYGYKLTYEQYSELARIHEQLVAMDKHVDSDKQVLQNKLLKACEFSQEVEESIQSMLMTMNETIEHVSLSQSRFQIAVQEAQLIATKAAAIIDTLAGNSRHFQGIPEKDDSSHNNNQHHHHHSHLAQSPDSTSSSSTIRSLADKIPFLKTGPLRKLLFQKRYVEAKQMTENLNELVEKATQLLDEANNNVLPISRDAIVDIESLVDEEQPKYEELYLDVDEMGMIEERSHIIEQIEEPILPTRSRSNDGHHSQQDKNHQGHHQQQQHNNNHHSHHDNHQKHHKPSHSSHHSGHRLSHDNTRQQQHGVSFSVTPHRSPESQQHKQLQDSQKEAHLRHSQSSEHILIDHKIRMLLHHTGELDISESMRVEYHEGEGITFDMDEDENHHHPPHDVHDDEDEGHTNQQHDEQEHDTEGDEDEYDDDEVVPRVAFSTPSHSFRDDRQRASSGNKKKSTNSLILEQVVSAEHNNNNNNNHNLNTSTSSRGSGQSDHNEIRRSGSGEKGSKSIPIQSNPGASNASTQSIPISAPPQYRQHFHEKEVERQNLTMKAHRLSKKIDSFALLHHLNDDLEGKNTSSVVSTLNIPVSAGSHQSLPVKSQSGLSLQLQQAQEEQQQQPQQTLSQKSVSSSQSSTPSHKSLSTQRHSWHQGVANNERTSAGSGGSGSGNSGVDSKHVLSRYAKRWAPVNNGPDGEYDPLAEYLEEHDLDLDDQQHHHSPLHQLIPPEITRTISTSLESVGHLFSHHILSKGHPQPSSSASTSTFTLSTSSLASSSTTKPIDLDQPTTSGSALVQSKQLKNLEQASQRAQQNIVKAHKSVEYYKRALTRCQEAYEQLKVKEEELNLYKKRLCDQLKLLVEDSNRGRSQKLLFVSENYTV